MNSSKKKQRDEILHVSMKKLEKRKFIRFDSLHLLDFIVLDEAGKPGLYSMGRTIDVSIDGIKIETVISLKINTRLLLTIGLQDDLIDLEGLITHEESSGDRFISGLSFQRITKDGRRVLAKYVEAFQERNASLVL